MVGCGVGLCGGLLSRPRYQARRRLLARRVRPRRRRWHRLSRHRRPRYWAWRRPQRVGCSKCCRWSRRGVRITVRLDGEVMSGVLLLLWLLWLRDCLHRMIDRTRIAFEWNVAFQIRTILSYGKTFLHPSGISFHFHIYGKFEFHGHLLQCKEFVLP